MDYKKTCYIVDSSSGIKSGQIPDVYVMPLIVIETKENKEEVSYLSDVDLSTHEVLELLKKGANLKTSQSNIGQMMELTEELFKKYDSIFVVPISSGISGTYQSWLTVASDFENKNLFVIDAKEVATGIADVLDDIKKLVSEKTEINEIKSFVEARSKRRCGVLIVTDITQLKKGGRISSFKATIVKLLKMNLLISYDGKLDFFDKETNEDKAIEKALKKINDETSYLAKGIKRIHMYTSYQDESENQRIAKILEKKIGAEIKYSLFPATISIHTGLNTFAIFIEAKE